jgi:hypothetical protein
MRNVTNRARPPRLGQISMPRMQIVPRSRYHGGLVTKRMSSPAARRSQPTGAPAGCSGSRHLEPFGPLRLAL